MSESAAIIKNLDELVTLIENDEFTEEMANKVLKIFLKNTPTWVVNQNQSKIPAKRRLFRL